MRVLSILIVSLGLISCSPVKIPATNEYQLTEFSTRQWATKPHHVSILVTAPEAVAGFQTEEMLYIKKPFQLESFVKNSWTAPPADMLFPLMVQTMQRSGYFYAVTSSPYSEEADYRLDTQVISLAQSFLKKPSILEFTVKIVLTRTDDNKVVGSQIISQHVPCLSDTPYGGVVAANKASQLLTARVADFVVSHIKSGSAIAKK